MQQRPLTSGQWALFSKQQLFYSCTSRFHVSQMATAANMTA